MVWKVFVSLKTFGLQLRICMYSLTADSKTNMAAKNLL
jgi:hypothetical protein